MIYFPCFYVHQIAYNFMANGTEAWRIKNTNFPAKYMNCRSPSLWNIHQVSVRSASCETIAGVLVFQGCTIMRNIIAYMLFKVNFVSFFFFCIFYMNVMFASILISNTTTQLTLMMELQIITKFHGFVLIKVLLCHNSPILSILDSKLVFLQ